MRALRQCAGSAGPWRHLPALKEEIQPEAVKCKHADPFYDASYPGTGADSHDIAVIDFADRDTGPADLWTFTPATLPSAGQLSELGSRQLDALPWLVVGYGTEEATRGPGGHVHNGGGARLKAEEGFNALNPTWIRLSMIEAQGYGGACYGDSGGPNFVTMTAR